MAARRNHPTSEVRGNSREEPPCVRGQRRQLRGATHCPSPGVVARRSHPTPEARDSSWEEQPKVQGAVAARAQEGLEELLYLTLKVRKGCGVEIPFIQGKEQRLCFAGAAVKRYHMPKVRKMQVRW